MVLYGPNFSLMFLNHLFLYKGVYCTIRVVIRTFIMDTCEIYMQVTQPCKNYLEAYISAAKPRLTWRLVNLFQTFFNKSSVLQSDKLPNDLSNLRTHSVLHKENGRSKHAARNLPISKTYPTSVSLLPPKWI